MRVAVVRRCGLGGATQDVIAGMLRHRTYLGDSQTVLAQRPGLVEADHLDATERLGRAWDPHQRPVFAQPLRRRGLGEGGHQGHALGDGRHGDRDGATERLAHTARARNKPSAPTRMPPPALNGNARLISWLS